MQEHPGDDDVDVAAQHARNVYCAFALAELDLGWRQIHGVAAELEHGHFEGDPCTERWLLKDQRGRAARQASVGPAAETFQREGVIEQRQNASGGQVGDAQIVTERSIKRSR